MPTTNRADAIIERIKVSAYTIPTDLPESDGTLEWDATTLVLVELQAGDKQGIGYTYADTATAHLIHDKLRAIVQGRDALDVPGAWAAMVHSIRNLGRPGIASMAIAAVDVALWDLKAKLLDISLAALLGRVHEGVPVYGSGGFTSYSLEQLQQQLGGWANQGLSMVKMKIGRDAVADWERVHVAREAIGPAVKLFVDANGGYSRKQALAQADVFAQDDVQWFEEPVPANDLAGLRLLRDRAPGGMDIAAGEYGYDLSYFQRLLAAEAVDVLQADASRCAGITGFLQVGALCQAQLMPLSAHCAPSLHVAVCCALPQLRHLEYFHDHVRIEQMLFDGAIGPQDGMLRPDRSRPGLGLQFKSADAARYAVL